VTGTYQVIVKYKRIAETIIELKNADLQLREELIIAGKLFEGYNKEMEALHIRNVESLNNLIDEIGYPTIAKVGKDANEAAWLIIQHAISQPTFMRKCLKLLGVSVNKGNAPKTQFAYLSDRISVLEGKPQLYGTQFDWDENGELSPQPFDDFNNVNQRRKELHLNTLEEQTEVIRQRAKSENENPPKDFTKRKQHYDAWRKRVGWK
jgi:hypothetical protein